MHKIESMILSMTGFGKSEGQIGQKHYTVELRSLNSKQLDINVRMPSPFKEKEMALRNHLAASIFRGKVDITIYYDSLGEEKKLRINKELMAAYYSDLRTVAERIGQQEVDYMSLLMRIPDAMSPEKQELDEKEWSAIMDLINKALAQFIEYRSNEGKVLQEDFSMRIDNILEHLKSLEEPVKKRKERVKKRLFNNLEEFIPADKVDHNRYEQEVLYYLEKLDVTEEQVRLQKNCEHFTEALGTKKSQGKKLGFISQEIGREINTIGSKANDADMQRIVVGMKDELEKIKEQTLNVL